MACGFSLSFDSISSCLYPKGFSRKRPWSPSARRKYRGIAKRTARQFPALYAMSWLCRDGWNMLIVLVTGPGQDWICAGQAGSHAARGCQAVRSIAGGVAAENSSHIIMTQNHVSRIVCTLAGTRALGTLLFPLAQAAYCGNSQRFFPLNHPALLQQCNPFYPLPLQIGAENLFPCRFWKPIRKCRESGADIAGTCRVANIRLACRHEPACCAPSLPAMSMRSVAKLTVCIAYNQRISPRHRKTIAAEFATVRVLRCSPFPLLYAIPHGVIERPQFAQIAGVTRALDELEALLKSCPASGSHNRSG